MAQMYVVLDKSVWQLNKCKISMSNYLACFIKLSVTLNPNSFPISLFSVLFSVFSLFSFWFFPLMPAYASVYDLLSSNLSMWNLSIHLPLCFISFPAFSFALCLNHFPGLLLFFLSHPPHVYIQSSLYISGCTFSSHQLHGQFNKLEF